MKCPDCFSANLKEHGFYFGKQRYICQECQRKCHEGTLLKPVGVCRHCKHQKKIHNQEEWLCRDCNYNLKRQYKIQKSRKVEGSQCESTPSTEERHGYAECQGCHQIKLIANKKNNLCKNCYNNFIAFNGLKRLIENYTSSFEYNQYLFNLLSSEINWEKVDEVVRRRFSNFGKFLQKKFIPNPITWQVIEEVLPEITQDKVRQTKDIRQCLLAIGHILASRGKLETHEKYRKRKVVFSRIEKAAKTYQEILFSYAEFLEKSKRTLENIQNHLQIVIDFLEWCENQGIHSVEIIQPQIIQNYIKRLKSEYYCKRCDFDFSVENSKQARKCPVCNQIDSVINGKNFSKETIRKYKGKLIVFFDWLKLNRKTIINPVRGIVIPSSAKIQHYPQEMIYKLWEYAQSEKAEPTKALILYLIIAHAFSKTELSTAQIPQVVPLNLEFQTPSLASIYSVTLPHPSASYQKYSPGRPSAAIYFSQSAESWLKPLLCRYENYRNSIVKNPKNSYLLVTLNNALHVKPVTKTFVLTQVREVTFEVLGTPCNIGLLRKTVAVMYADKTNGSILKQFGWEEQQAFFYTWGDRELINL
jgi:transposase-like protein